MPQQRPSIDRKMFTAYNVLRDWVHSILPTIHSKISYIKKSDFRQKFLVHSVETDDLLAKFDSAAVCKTGLPLGEK